MDRLFGKELSNMLEPTLPHKSKFTHRVASKSTCAPSKDEKTKLVHKKSDKPSSAQKEPIKPKAEPVEEIKIQVGNGKVKDVQLVPEYFDECLQHMLDHETKSYCLSNYMEEQSDINQKMRGILLDWLVELHHKFKMFPQTLYAVTMIIDKYLSKKAVKKENLQLVGTAAFFLAAKYEETYQVPEVGDLVHFAAKAFTKQQVVRMEAEIIQVLEFELIMTTSYRFFEALAKISNMETKNFHLAQYVLELSLLDIRFLQYKPSLMAASAIYLINKIRKRQESWPDLLVAATGYEEVDLKNCARDLCYLLEKADDLPNTKSLKKKFSTAAYNEVTRIKLQRRKQ